MTPDGALTIVRATVSDLTEKRQAESGGSEKHLQDFEGEGMKEIKTAITRVLTAADGGRGALTMPTGRP